jgi:ubiquinone/menaquinone biosynthesis C-methylase UbiE
MDIMSEISVETLEHLQAGMDQLILEPQKAQQKEGIRALLANCGLPNVDDLYAAIHDAARSTRILKLDRDFIAELKDEEWLLFMNHGYLPAKNDSRSFPILKPDFANWQNQANLYFHLFDFAKNRLACLATGTCDVLDVGCGRGSGIVLLKENFGLRNAIGIDINPLQIDFCRKRHVNTGVEFLVGNAMQMPIASESVDVVLNIESSHCYESFPKFLAEVGRVLRPNGLLLMADNRVKAIGEMLAIQAAFLNSELRLLYKEDLTVRVQEACKIDAEKFGRIFESPKAEIVGCISHHAAACYENDAGSYWAFFLGKNSPQLREFL